MAKSTAWLAPCRGRFLSGEAEAAFGVGEHRTPDEPVQGDDEHAHHHDAEHDARIIAGFGRCRDVGADAVRLDLVVAPLDVLGDDAGVP